MSQELGHLFQGFKHPDPNECTTGTNTCHWILPSEIPDGRTATYVRVVTAYRPQKAKPFPCPHDRRRQPN